MALTIVFLSGAPASRAEAALWEYTRGLFSIDGYVATRLEKRTTDTDGTSTDAQELQEEFDVNLSGFVWDPRFMLFTTGVTVVDTNSSSGSGSESGNLYIGYRFDTKLFPRWTYPFRPVHFYLNKSLSTIEPAGRAAYDVDTTSMGVKWGLYQRWFGDVRLFYDFNNSLSANEGSERDETNHKFEAEARRVFRPDKWGSSELEYGYRLDTSIDNIDDSSFLQHHLYGYDTTKFGEKVRGSGNADFYLRDSDFGAGGESDTSTILNLRGKLDVRATERFTHSYGAGMNYNQSSGLTNASYNGDAGFSYNHPFNEYWNGGASSRVNGRYAQQSGNASSTTGGVNASGSLSYARQHGDFLVSGNASLGGAQSFGGVEGGSTTLYQSIQGGYSRSTSPLYVDSLNIGASSNYTDNSTTHDLTGRYEVTSNLTAQDILQGSGSLRYGIGEGDAFNASVSVNWDHQFSRLTSSGLTFGQNVSLKSTADTLKTYIRGRYKTAFFQSRNLRFNSSFRWENVDGSRDDSGSELNGDASLEYVIGRWSAGLEYEFRQSDRGDSGAVVEHTIYFTVTRRYGFRF